VSGLYVDRLDHLVEEGIFLSQGEVFRDALRRTFRAYGLEPFREVREIEGENDVLEDSYAPVDLTDEKETN